MNIASLNQDNKNAVLGVSNSINGNFWNFRFEDDRRALNLSQRLGVPEIIGRIICGRNINDSEVEDFLDPKLRKLMPDPSCLKDMSKATKRTLDAIINNEKISIFGDYDVDGATSSALLVRYFRSINLKVETYIPDRIKEGYGPNINSIDKLHKSGSNLIITVDCGTTSYEPIKKAKELGIDLIVLDHHKSDVYLPDAFAIVNPNRVDDDHDNSNLNSLAAVGVAFLFIVSLNRELKNTGFFGTSKIPDLRKFLDLVALGTVCDLVPLNNLNRAFVINGLKVIKKRINLGIVALSEVGKIYEQINSYHLGYILGPRVNAGGRVGESYLGSQILEIEDFNKVKEIALRLDRYNFERKQIEEEVLKEAINIINLKSLYKNEVIIIYKENWHIGVLGIVASRITEKFKKPSIVLSALKGVLKGSGRSVYGFDLGVNIINAKNLNIITNGGGHSMAAGLTMKIEKIDEFEDFIYSKAKEIFAYQSKINYLYIDSILNSEAVSHDLISLIEKIGPFGYGNPTPRFLINNLTLLKVFTVGKDHVSCIFKSEGGKTLKGIAFRSLSEDLGRVLLSSQGKNLHVVGQLRNNTWNGKVEQQLTIEDIALV